MPVVRIRDVMFLLQCPRTAGGLLTLYCSTAVQCTECIFTSILVSGRNRLCEQFLISRILINDSLGVSHCVCLPHMDSLKLCAPCSKIGTASSDIVRVYELCIFMSWCSWKK
ncbi:hypothetical protein KC19_3G210700 [Ceratodon purpureus]|uniref:Uncharacterized protein n=1 Tax=Ceratodon purpureus TaxID=3225 RepID=A0A8T0INN5_CERPU|nr:hypothetical protein KC19_N021000 [Ceratodon purpureus]KAG0584441.1 hypothetical protein KC19_3G209700 [Ceratodon purpureus]KAG0584452.1 hypothetical protein KC19_3G210700 [Ceratodon purpureus]